MATLDKIIGFLKDTFSSDVTVLARIGTGQTSQTFLFLSGSNEFILKVHSESLSFEKDKYAYEHFASEQLPIPKVLRIGKMNETLFYLISERAKGQTVDQLDEKQLRDVLPEIVGTLDAIRGCALGATGGFGDLNSHGDGTESSWQNYLRRMIDDINSNKKPEDVPLGAILARYEELIPYCPNVRYLVHGDFIFSNVIVDCGKISAVLDWELSKYGDFLYDLAWVDIYLTDTADVFQRHYEKNKLDVLNFDERLLCYKLHYTLGGLGFYFDRGQSELYSWFKEKVLELLNERDKI